MSLVLLAGRALLQKNFNEIPKVSSDLEHKGGFPTPRAAPTGSSLSSAPFAGRCFKGTMCHMAVELPETGLV